MKLVQKLSEGNQRPNDRYETQFSSYKMVHTTAYPLAPDYIYNTHRVIQRHANGINLYKIHFH